jgi:DNA repair photolyase
MNNKTVFGTYEWAVKNANFINGCSHDCKYCYSKEMAIRYKRKLPSNWKIEEINPKQLAKKFKKIDGTIMFPSSHDITPENLNQSIIFIQNLLEPGNRILIVSKPHLTVIKEICNRFIDYKENILFRFTIGSLNSAILKFWEPNAPSFEERFDALKLAYHNGFKTSISCEPLLDNKPIQLIAVLEPFVTDSIWVGKANFLLRRLKMNGFNDPETIHMAEKLI